MSPRSSLNIRWKDTSAIRKDLLPEGMERATIEAATQRVHELRQAAQSFADESLGCSWCVVNQAANPAQCNDNTMGDLVRALRTNTTEVLLSKMAIKASRPPPFTNSHNSAEAEELTAKLARPFSCHPYRGHEDCAPLKEWNERLWTVVGKPPPMTKGQETHFK
jgi:hypothetical protein